MSRPPLHTRAALLAALAAVSASSFAAAPADAVAAPAAPAATTADAAATAADGRVVVSADFSGNALPAGFRAVEGGWEVRDGRLYGTSASTGQQSRLTFGEHLEDFRIEVTARFESVTDPSRWTAMGLDMPADGAQPWSIATMRSGTTAANGLEFAQRTAAGGWNVTDTTPAPSAAGTGRDVRIAAEVHGTRARWFFDGREVMRTTRVARSAAGVEALVVNSATVSFDDLKVTELPPEGLIRAAGSPLTVLAHRGGSSAAPEDTLVSDEVGRRGGADFIENDVQPSLDGVPYVLHDPTVDRTTDGTGAIRSLTSAQLDSLDAGSWFAPAYAGARIPTLAAQLEDLRTRGGNLLLEIKGAHTRDQVATIVKTIRDHGMTDRVVVQSFSVDSLRYTRELAPELRLGLLRGSLDADPVAVARELHLAAYNPSDGALTKRPGVVADLHAAGVAVMVWTVDSPARWKALEAAGVDGIITNRPAELSGWNAAWLQNRLTAPTVAVTSPAAGAALDRAQTPVPAVRTTGADTVKLTLDGAPVEAGRPLDLTALRAGEHTLRAEATGTGGTAAATAVFTVRATPTGLAHLVLTSGAEERDIATMLGMVGRERYDKLARWAERHADRFPDRARASVIAADADALDAR